MKLKLAHLKFGALATMGLGISSCDMLMDNSKGAIPTCVEETTASLKSPSSFKLLWSDYTARPPMPTEERFTSLSEEPKCDGDCGAGASLIAEYAGYVMREGPRFAERLKRNAKLNDIERQAAEQWLSIERSRREYAAKIAKNLPEDQSAFVTLEYEAKNAFGTDLRAFAVCRFGAVGQDGRFDKNDIFLSGPIDDETGKSAKLFSRAEKR